MKTPTNAGRIVTLHLKRCSRDRTLSRIIQITVYLSSSSEKTSFHFFCADLDTHLFNLSNFPHLQCEFHNSSDTVDIQRVLSAVPAYMPHLTSDMLVIHGELDEEDDEAEGESGPSAESIVPLPSHYWLGDYDPNFVWGAQDHGPRVPTISDRTMYDVPREGGLLENDMTVVGYSY